LGLLRRGSLLFSDFWSFFLLRRRFLFRHLWFLRGLFLLSLSLLLCLFICGSWGLLFSHFWRSRRLGRLAKRLVNSRCHFLVDFFLRLWFGLCLRRRLQRDGTYWRRRGRLNALHFSSKFLGSCQESPRQRITL